MKILYIDPVFGISGDMMISAFIDAGLPFSELKDALDAIPLALPAITPARRTEGVLNGIHLDIEDSHIHLSIDEMEKAIEGLALGERIKKDVRGMLNIILEAEAKVHGISRDHLHLHELSHVDTLIDLVGVAVGMNYFGIESVRSGPVPHGRGTIRTSHGIIPNPPPVTLEILSGFKVVFLEEPLELTTPTGATIVKYYVKDQRRPPSFTIEKTGYGLGSYKTDKPDVLRIFIGKSEPVYFEEETWLIEVDLDDMEMEYVGAVADRIRGAGALDVLYFPVYMKKGRMGIRLSVTAKEETLPHLVDTLFMETTTFGLRFRREGRQVLRREEKSVDTSHGPIRVKYGYDRYDNPVKTHIEFEDVKTLADAAKVPYRTILDALKKEIG
jgi:uncharacterized protein (TIGR00299 family) protein